MPKQACCCNPVGRHVAVACRYYGRSTIFSLNGDVGATSGAGSSGSSGGSGRSGGSGGSNNIVTGIEYGYGGEDGFLTVTGGVQKFFAWGPAEPGFGNDGSGFAHRGPVRWNAEIKQFDSTRDVILLSRSGGGSSQYEYDEDEPKGGHSALLQTRVKASLALKGFAGIGGDKFSGGMPTLIGDNVQFERESTIVGGGAGGGGGNNGRGGYGGISSGYRGDGLYGGFGGNQSSPGTAGGSGAFAGSGVIGGSGGNAGGGGGGGRYAGGGGDRGSGGGGGASKWPQGGEEESTKYSEDASDLGPGGICDPFLNFYPLDTGAPIWQAGMGGGANTISDAEGEAGGGSSTNFVGFGYDYNPFKQGIPGIINAIWVDKYCPCELAGSGSSGASGNQEISLNSEGSQNESAASSSEELPSKMYICLNDAQYQVLENFKDPENPDLDVSHPRFTLDGEVYVYVGVCVNAYCSSVRLVEGTPTNLAKTDLGGNGAASFNGTYNDCCDTMICSKYCRIPQADCYGCRCSTTCPPESRPKYCCEGLDSKPDEYWSISEGWLWRCQKIKKFWYPFGIKPTDTLPPTNEIIINDTFVNGPFEKGCLPVTSSGLTGEALSDFINGICFPENSNIDCTDYLGWNSSKCNITLPFKYWEGKQVWPISINAGLCLKFEDYQRYAFSTGLPVNCDCLPSDIFSCVSVGCNRDTEEYSFSFSTCDLTPSFFGTYFGGKVGGCRSPNNPNGNVLCNVEQSYNNLNREGTCREVLGMTITIPRCHPDPANPQITDPLKYVVDSTTIGNSIFNFERDVGWFDLCEKRIVGYGTLGEFASKMQSGLQMDIQINVNEPRLWLSKRPYKRPCDGVEYLIQSDYCSRMQVTETVGEAIVEFYFIPYGQYYQVSAAVSAPNYGSARKYSGDSPVCNTEACECTANKSFEIDSYNSAANEFSYFSEAYYLFEHESGDPPSLVKGEFQITPEFGNNPDQGISVLPADLAESICPNAPETVGGGGRAIRPKSDCITQTIGDFPLCEQTNTVETNVCRGDFLSISYG
jgi:hypothetical protein